VGVLPFIMQQEGWNPRAYGDYKQTSVGYGTRARFPGEVIDRAEGERRLSAEVDQARGYVTKRFPNLAPNQTDALTSFTYNLGPGWMNQPTRLRAALESGDMAGAARIMQEYNKAGGAVLPGLVKRRNAEAAMFLGGAAPGIPASQSPHPQQSPQMEPAPMADDGWSLSKALATPMFQSGLGGFLAAARGGDTNEGMNAGSQRAMAMQRSQQMADEQARRQRMEAAFNQPGAMAGVDPAIANIARLLGPEQGGNLIAKSLMDRMQAEQGLNTQKQLIDYRNQTSQTDDIREFQYAKNNGFSGGFQDWMKQKRDMNGQTAQQITWGTDDKGNYVPMQASRDGKLVASQMPQGVTPVPAEILALRKAAATEQGQAVGKAKAELPAVEANAKLMIDAINAVEKDPYLPRMTQGLSSWLLNVSPEARASQARIDQVQGKAFLQAYAGLRGGGAITEAEGAKATASISRLQSMQVGTEEYKRALADVRKEVEALVDLARRKAAAGEPSYSVRPQPSPTAQPAPVDTGGWSAKRLD